MGIKTFEEWKAKYDDEIVNVATVFFNYERGVDTRTCYDELEWLLRKAFISGQNHCNCSHTDNSKVIERLEKENKRLLHELELIRGQKGICLEIDGKNMTDVYNLQQMLNEKDIIINFLKKELAHKMSYRQTMKKQYRELKQSMMADNERHTKAYAKLVAENAKLRHIAEHYCIEWHNMELNPDDFPPEDPEHCGFSITVMADDGGTAYANLEQKRWCTSRPIKAWFKIPRYLTFKYDGVVR